MIREGRYQRSVGMGADRNSLGMLLAILAIVFCIFKFIYIVYELGLEKGALYRPQIFNWFALPANTADLVRKPWTLLTYMFMHDRVFHLLGNLLWLWGFGFIFQDLAGGKRIVPVFLTGGFAGGVVFVLAFNLIPGLKGILPVATLEGASAGIMAIALAATTLAPGYRLFPMIAGGIPLWVLTLVFVIIDFASITSQNAGGHLSHLAGAVAGFAFAYALKKGYDASKWYITLSEKINGLFSPAVTEKSKAKDEFFYNTGGVTPFKRHPNVTQSRIDEILDKINQKGFRSLTEEEKEILKRASQSEEL